MDLVHDLLDARVVDRHGVDMGRVDGIVLSSDAGAALRVVAIEVGPSVLARRISRALGRVVEGLEHALGIDAGRPLRIPMSDVLSIGEVVTVNLAFGETSAANVEERLRRWVRRVPVNS